MAQDQQVYQRQQAARLKEAQAKARAQSQGQSNLKKGAVAVASSNAYTRPVVAALRAAGFLKQSKGDKEASSSPARSSPLKIGGCVLAGFLLGCAPLTFLLLFVAVVTIILGFGGSVASGTSTAVQAAWNAIF